MARYRNKQIAHSYGDDNASTIVARVWKVQLLAQRLILSMAASPEYTIIYIQDITRSYIQPEVHFRREVYTRPSKIMNLPFNKLLNVPKTLNGIPESRLYCYPT